MAKSLITEDSYFGLKPASLAVALVFIVSTSISIGWMFADNAQAKMDITKLQTNVTDINKERNANREKYLETLSQINDRLARIETKLGTSSP
jgi:hypothetical protein